jgi:hypothetical protein
MVFQELLILVEAEAAAEVLLEVLEQAVTVDQAWLY